MFWVGCYKKTKFKDALKLASWLGLSTIVEKDAKGGIKRIYDIEFGKWLETEEDYVATADKFGRL